MQKELVSLFSLVTFPIDGGDVVPARHVTALNAEAATLGYTFDKDAMTQLGRLSAEGFAAVRRELLDVLGEVSGANRRHAALFNKFPYDTPEDGEYLVKRILGFVQSHFGTARNDYRVLSCGHVIDPALFDLDEFSACPVCQFQVPELGPQPVVRHEFKSITPLKVLSYADGALVGAKAGELLARNSSLSAAEKAFLTAAKGKVEIARPQAVFRETLPFVYALFEDVEYVRGLMSGATDVLRVAAYLSKADADLSLKENVKFKLATRHKKNLLRLLESLDGIEEDLLRHRERWLRLGELLNPGSAKNRGRYPNTARAFDVLRNMPERVATFSRVVEKRVRARSVDESLLGTLRQRPGEFLRRVDFLLRTAGDPEPVLAVLPPVAAAAPTKLLFEVGKYLRHRAAAHGQPRVFLPKGSVTRMQVVEDKRAPIPAAVLERAAAALDAELAKRFARLPELGRVYVDPALRDVVMPFNRRGDSATSVAMPKGSRFPLGAGAVVRLFVWWKGMVDVDLSLNCYDAEFGLRQNISFHNLKGSGCVHSGDIQRAPDGASEFIDFEVETLRRNGIRYAVSSVISFTGDGFNGFPCFAGWMERDALRSGSHYEPESVRLKFDITADTNSVLPLVFDLERRTVTFADLTTGGGRGATMAGGTNKFAALARATLALAETKPTAYDVLAAHAKARGTLVDDPAEAETVHALDTLDLEKVCALMA